MTKIEVTLSRAHKIAERLKDLIKATFAEVEAKAEVKSYSSRPAPSAMVELVNRDVEVLALSEKAAQYSDAWVAVRSAIASENNKRGIDTMLARLEAIGKRVTSHKLLVEASKEDGHLPAEVVDYVPESTAYGFNLTINPLREASIAATLKDQLAALQREAMKLSDDIAEANGPRVTLELSEEIAAEVTGAGA